MPLARVLFTPAARADIISAQTWYYTQAAGLEDRFQAALDTAVERLTSNALHFPAVFRAVRRARLRTFPYGLFFLIEDDMVLVIACFHASRNPELWRGRI